jgi:hypothetical protein
MADRKFLNPEEVIETWGKDFAPFSTDKNVRFTETEIGFKLSRPMNIGEGKPIDELFVHEPNVSDLKETDAAPGEIAKSAILLRVLAGVPQSAINKMRGRDFIRINQVLTLFLVDSPPTGETPSAT